MRLALNALSSARKLTQNTWSSMSSTQSIPSMTLQKDLGHVLGQAAPAPGPAVVVGRV